MIAITVLIILVIVGVIIAMCGPPLDPHGDD